MEQRYANEIVGANVRLTDVAAAIGRVQLGKLPAWTAQRQANAKFLSEGIKTLVVPPVADGAEHVYHQYTVRVPAGREAVQAELTTKGIGNAVYYPTPIHRLKPFAEQGPSSTREWDLPETERAAAQVLSLPVHPSLTQDELDRIVAAVNALEGSL
jgi:dTDP-4-amino-4,6-dideoxygalactose transaminase